MERNLLICSNDTHVYILYFAFLCISIIWRLRYYEQSVGDDLSPLTRTSVHWRESFVIRPSKNEHGVRRDDFYDCINVHVCAMSDADRFSELNET